jgi:hypothetical protein
MDLILREGTKEVPVVDDLEDVDLEDPREVRDVIGNIEIAKNAITKLWDPLQRPVASATVEDDLAENDMDAGASF